MAATSNLHRGAATPPASASTTRSEDAARYDAVARALHWGMAVLLLAQIAFGLSLDELWPRGTPSRGAMVNLHKSFGIVLGVLVIARLAWRWRHSPPAWPASLAPSAQRLAAWGHRALYAVMVLLPACGYLASNFSKHGVRFFGVPLAPWGPNLPSVYSLLNGLHAVLAWALIALVVGHVLAAWLHLRRRDGVFERMGARR